MSLNGQREHTCPVVCFGGEDWWYHNRGHCDMQFMRQLARDHRVLYINSVGMRKPVVTEGAMFWRRVVRKAGSMARGLVRVADAMWVYAPFTAPVHHVPGARRINQTLLAAQTRLAMRRLRMERPMVWVNCPSAADAALRLGHQKLVYQRTDRYEDYPHVDRRAIARDDRLLRRNADLTLYSNRALYEAERSLCRHAAYVEHGVDYDRFVQAARDRQTPSELRTLPRPVAGFFGAIDAHKFNLPLITEVARRCPEISFVFVGEPSIDCSELRGLDNVTMIPRRDYEQIPHYGAAFDVCLMPFNQNDWVSAMNPIKLKEYLALGKPVVSTPIGELSQFENLIRVAPTAEPFASAIRRAVREDSAELVDARRERVRKHSWAAKAEEVMATLWNGEHGSPEWNCPSNIGRSRIESPFTGTRFVYGGDLAVCIPGKDAK
jgi:glycosyltransferase involved in cell wall biosynthesis